MPSARLNGERRIIEQAAEAQGWGEVGAPKAGTTTLDRVHQAMLLFGAGRGEALKRRCEELLRQAEARVEKITLDAGGKPTGTEPLDVN